MYDLPTTLDMHYHNSNQSPEREATRAHYFGLRDKLVSLKSAPEPNLAAIDAVVHELEHAQLAYKATYGMFGNNPIDDAAHLARPGANGHR